MTVHFFDLEKCPPRPWKNGGGATREIVCWSPGGDINQFAWRVSVADINIDGLFSVFPGIERTILLIHGNGVQLTASDGRFDHYLTQCSESFQFAGDVELNSRLLDGATRDLNVMVARQDWSADTHVIKDAGTLPSGNYGFLFVSQGEWLVVHDTKVMNIDGQFISGYGLWWAEEELSISVSPRSENSCLIYVAIHKKHNE
jgi:environmental stress-induced protein Ves